MNQFQDPEFCKYCDTLLRLSLESNWDQVQRGYFEEILNEGADLRTIQHALTEMKKNGQTGAEIGVSNGGYQVSPSPKTRFFVENGGYTRLLLDSEEEKRRLFKRRDLEEHELTTSAEANVQAIKDSKFAKRLSVAAILIALGSLIAQIILS